MVRTGVLYLKKEEQGGSPVVMEEGRRRLSEDVMEKEVGVVWANVS